MAVATDSILMNKSKATLQHLPEFRRVSASSGSATLPSRLSGGVFPLRAFFLSSVKSVGNIVGEFSARFYNLSTKVSIKRTH